MKVVITGAGGTLGRALAPMLVKRGDAVTLFDISELDADLGEDAPLRIVRADVRDARDTEQAIDGADIVVHTAAIHGIHLADHSPREFYELNVGGTFNVWQAAVAAKVKGVLFSSTMGVYGESRRPRGDDDAVEVSESMALRPADIYGWTKVVGEEMSQYHWRHDRIPSISLRYGMFVPEPFFRYGVRLLYGGVHEADVARATVAAIDALAAGRQGHEAFNVHSYLPFTAADGPSLRHEPLSAIRRHYPGGRELLEARGVKVLQPIDSYFGMAAIADRLGFRPKHNFADWLAELERRPGERAEKSPPWP